MLEATDVASFLATPKRCLHASAVTWQRVSLDYTAFQCPIETVASTEDGYLFVGVNCSFGRNWTFKITLDDEEIIVWHLKEPPTNHRNPGVCPPGFPKRVTADEHEHVWVEDADLVCVRELTLTATGHEDVFMQFCARTAISATPTYAPPDC